AARPQPHLLHQPASTSSTTPSAARSTSSADRPPPYSTTTTSTSSAATPTAFTYGYLIINSRIDNADGTLAAGADYLSRPWRHTGTTNPVAQMTIRETYLGTAVSSAHYENWSSPFFKWTDARYSEYQNTGPAAVDVAPDVPQLTDTQAASYTILTYFADWRPFSPLGFGLAKPFTP